MSRQRIAGGEAVFYGDKKDFPCGVSLNGTDDLGSEGSIDFEIFSCADLAIRRTGEPDRLMTSLNRFNPQEVVNVLAQGFKNCGCPVKLKE